jgi:hypothetical protein
MERKLIKAEPDRLSIDASTGVKQLSDSFKLSELALGDPNEWDADGHRSLFISNSGLQAIAASVCLPSAPDTSLQERVGEGRRIRFNSCL